MFQVSSRTARDNWEEGEDDAKSAWSLIPWAAHMIQWRGQWVAKPRGGANPNKPRLSPN